VYRAVPVSSLNAEKVKGSLLTRELLDHVGVGPTPRESSRIDVRLIAFDHPTHHESFAVVTLEVTGSTVHLVGNVIGEFPFGVVGRFSRGAVLKVNSRVPQFPSLISSI
jgi:hypothetical protein